MVKTIWIRLYLRIGFGVVSVEGRLLNLLIFIETGDSLGVKTTLLRRLFLQGTGFWLNWF